MITSTEAESKDINQFFLCDLQMDLLSASDMHSAWYVDRYLAMLKQNR